MTALIHIVPADFPVARMGGSGKNIPILDVDPFAEIHLGTLADPVAWIERAISELQVLRLEVMAREAARDV